MGQHAVVESHGEVDHVGMPLAQIVLCDGGHDARPARQDVQEDRDIVRPEVPERVHVLPDRTEGGADAVDVLHPPSSSRATRSRIASTAGL